MPGCCSACWLTSISFTSCCPSSARSDIVLRPGFARRLWIRRRQGKPTSFGVDEPCSTSVGGAFRLWWMSAAGLLHSPGTGVMMVRVDPLIGHRLDEYEVE